MLSLEDPYSYLPCIWRDVTLTGALSETMGFPGCDTTCAAARRVNDRGRT
jgi:hypothetical protein